jgi:hypothetical protein
MTTGCFYATDGGGNARSIFGVVGSVYTIKRLAVKCYDFFRRNHSNLNIRHFLGGGGSGSFSRQSKAQNE